jgi:hypothetical protein
MQQIVILAVVERGCKRLGVQTVFIRGIEQGNEIGDVFGAGAARVVPDHLS